MLLPKAYKRLVGGVNYISGKTNVREFEFTQALNVDYAIDGSVAQRKGVAHYADTYPTDINLESYWPLNEGTVDGAGTWPINSYDYSHGRNNITWAGGGTELDRGTVVEWLGSRIILEEPGTVANTSVNRLDGGVRSGQPKTDGDFSISFWLYGADDATKYDLFECLDTGGNNGYRVQVYVSGGTVWLDLNWWKGTAGVTTVAYDTGVAFSIWQHVILCKKTETGSTDGAWRLYVNNSEITASSGAPFAAGWLTDNDWDSFGTGDFKIGDTSIASHALEDVMFWTEYLHDNASRRAALYNSGADGGSFTESVNTVATNKNVKAIFDFQPRDAEQEILCVAGGRLLSYDEGIGAFIPIRFPIGFTGTSGYLSDTLRCDIAQMFNRVYIGNGSDSNLRYEGQPDPNPTVQSLWEAGISEPTTEVPTSITFGTSGGDVEWVDDNGTRGEYIWYVYRIAPVRQDASGGRLIVGPPGPETTPLDAHNNGGVADVYRNDGKITFNTPAALGPEQTHWAVYRCMLSTVLAPDNAYWVDEPAEGAGQDWDASLTDGKLTPSNVATASKPFSAFYWIADVPVGTTGYEDTVRQDDALATADSLADKWDLATVPPCAIMETTSLQGTDQMLWSGNPNSPNSIYISDVNAGPDMYREGQEQFIGRDSNDVVTGMAQFYDSLIIFKNDRFFVGRPAYDLLTDPTKLAGGGIPWQFTLANDDVGCESNFSIQNVDNKLMWKDERGFYAMKATDSFGNIEVQRLSNRIGPTLQTIPYSRRGDIISAHLRTPQRRHYRFAYGLGNVNDSMFIYDYDHPSPDPLDESPVGAWLPWTAGNVEAMAVVENLVTGLDEIYVGDDNGFIYKMDSNDYDETRAVNAGGTANETTQSAINSSFTTSYLDHDLDHITKRWRQIVVEGITTATSGTSLTLRWESDFGIRKTPQSVILDMTPQKEDVGAIWDVDTYSTGIWGGSPVVIAVRKRLYQATGHHLQLTFDHSVFGGTYEIHGFWLYAVMVPSLRAVKSLNG